MSSGKDDPKIAPSFYASRMVSNETADYKSNQPDTSGQAERYPLDERLATLSYFNRDGYEDGMLELYSHVCELLVNAARRGLRSAIIRPDISKAEGVGFIIGPAKCMDAMAHLLRTEGLDAVVVGNGAISVKWPKLPPHWENRN